MWDSAAYGGVGQRWQHFAESITVCFFLYVFPCVAQHGCRATCDITSINTGNCFFSPYFLVWVQRRKGGGTRRGGGVTLALKPTIVLPPGHATNQEAQSG